MPGVRGSNTRHSARASPAGAYHTSLVVLLCSTASTKASLLVLRATSMYDSSVSWWMSVSVDGSVPRWWRKSLCERFAESSVL